MLTLLRMLAGKAGWLLLSFLLIVGVLAVSQGLPAKVERWQAEAKAAESLAATLEDGRDRFAADAQAFAATQDRRLAELQGAGAAQLAQAERQIASEKRAAQARVLDGPTLALAAARGQRDRVVASYRAQLAELPVLERAGRLIGARRRAAAHGEDVAAFNRLVAQRNALQRQAAAQRRYPFCREVPALPGCETVREVAALDRRIAARRVELTRQAEQVAAIRRASAQVLSSAAVVQTATSAYAAKADRAATEASGYAVNQGREALRRYSGTAAAILAAAVLLPILLKLFAFFVVAPLAGKARPIRLASPGPPLEAAASGMSVEVPLGPYTEILLRSGLQSSGADVRGGDLYLLDWSMPFTCLAAGLVNLQRLRSERPGHVVVTGTDETYRVAAIAVPSGGAAVLQPRSLLGIVKPRGADLVITRPWQLGRLMAWITLQLRFVVFHGPCTLIVQGRGGVVVEDAAKGRMVDKRLTLGFDAGLAYGAARSASFLPFLRGEASLFNDRFEGEGRYLFEQRSATAGRTGIWGRGLKGIGDAVLKAFGI